MLRDLKLFRRNSGKNPAAEEIENVPVHLEDSSLNRTGINVTRAPLNSIQEPIQNPKSATEQEASLRSKLDRTPSKFKGKGYDATLPLRTPDKQGTGFSSKNRFGWVKSDANSNDSETREEGRIDVGNGQNHAPLSCRGAGMNITPRSTRTIGRAPSTNSECNSTQNTPTKSVTKPPNPAFAPLSGSRSHMSGIRAGNFAALSRGIPVSSTPSTVVNTPEVPHFELKEDPSFWMDHNVQVLIRIRPLNNAELSSHSYLRCLKQESTQSITWVGQPEFRFTFDHVACETVNQEMLFRVGGLPMVENCLSGYNSCMFAYGQTGSGKTYTMLGEIDELEVKPSANRGMTPRIFEFLFARIRAEEESRRDEKLKYHCKCSFLEIYNEQITDLLDPSSTNLLLREDIKKGVYVENLTEFEVQTVTDILKLLSLGAANRRVAATNMNRESSRSHCVFTCVIESRWENDSTTNLRFARLNLVDLAGSERQKTSGAEGERLKEAANINKSLSTLGHVIMLLVDVAQGKQRHVPYRDSRLTFLLQDSLGGNSKTMIIANVSPSMCCAAETLSTLKFAQRAKLIQNNAVVNEDSSGDVLALRHQIQLLKEELFVLKRQNVSRSLSFGSTMLVDTDGEGYDTASLERIPEMDHQKAEDFHGSAPLGTVRVSTKQLKSLETILAGALRREKMSDTSIKQLEAEIEQLNRLVRQREEDTLRTKMMLKFREDKIRGMESLIGGLLPYDTYLMEENRALSKENELLRAGIDRNPEVTRFAMENIRLLDQLRRYQDFYEEGERELLLAEVSELRDKAVQFLDVKISRQGQDMSVLTQEAGNVGREDDSFRLELENTRQELEDYRKNLKSCMEINSKLTRELDDLHAQFRNLKPAPLDTDANVNPQKESLAESKPNQNHLLEEVEKEKWKHEMLMKHTEETMNLQLELDILKIILQEERSSRDDVEERTLCMCRNLELAKERCLQISKQFEDAKIELKDAKNLIEALESQHILSINELEDLRDRNGYYEELLSKQEQEITILKDRVCGQEIRDPPPLKDLRNESSPLQEKLNRMQDSLEKAKRLNMWYQSDRAFQTSHEQEMDEVCCQVEAETAEVIVCLQEELATLQQQVEDGNTKEMQSKQSLMLLESELKVLQEGLHLMTQENERLGKVLEQKDVEIRALSEDWERLGCEIEESLADGHEALNEASDQLDLISSSLPQRTWIGEQVVWMIRTISEKESLIEELQRCLEDANNIKSDMEWKLRSLRGAALAITEAQHQERSDKDNEIAVLMSELNEKNTAIIKLKNRVMLGQDQIRKAEVCAMVAFVIVNRFSEINSDHLNALKRKDLQLSDSMDMNLKKDSLFCDQAVVIAEAEKQIQFLKMELESSKESCNTLKTQLFEEKKHFCSLEQKLEEFEKDDILKTREKLNEFKMGISTLNSSMNEYTDQLRRPEKINIPGKHANICVEDSHEGRTKTETLQGSSNKGSQVEDANKDIPQSSFKLGNTVDGHSCELKNSLSERNSKGIFDKDLTIVLLRKELESALVSLMDVQAQMAELIDEKEEIRKCEKEGRKSIESLTAQVFALQAEISSMEKESDFKITALDNKLQMVEEIAQEAGNCWLETKKVLELELSNAKVVAEQKTAEASCLLAKFEEAQETMKEADVMVNALVAANDNAKLEIERLKRKEEVLVNEKDFLTAEVQNLQHSNYVKDSQYDDLEKQFRLNLSETMSQVLALEDIIGQVHTTFREEFESILCDFHCFKAQLLCSMKLMRSWLEDVWSEIIVKDCAVSVLHLCHMGILLETVTGLNAENGLLHHGLCESTSVIANLRDHNLKSERELEICRVLKGKLLVDIKNSFDRITRKEDETGKLSAKLHSFEKKILDLQLQEESMLARSNSIGSELAILMKELDLNNVNALTAILDQEQVFKDKEEVMKSQAEFILLGSTAKDIESLVLASELKLMGTRKAELEREQSVLTAILENTKKEMIFLKVDAEMEMQLLTDMELEVTLVNKEIEEARTDRHDLSLKLNRSCLKITEMDTINKTLELDIQSLKEVTSFDDKLKDELGGILEMKERLAVRVQELEAERERLLQDLGMKETTLRSSSDHIAVLDLTNQKLQNDVYLLEGSVFRLQTDLDLKDAEFKKMSSMEEEKESLEIELSMLKAHHCTVLKDLAEKESEFQSSLFLKDQEKCSLHEKIHSLETSICRLRADLEARHVELEEVRHSHSVTAEKFSLKSQDLETQIIRKNALKEENCYFRAELLSIGKNRDDLLSLLRLNTKICIDSVEALDMSRDRVFQVLEEKGITMLNNIFRETCENEERASMFIEESERLEHLAEELISENLSLKAELLRKDEVLKGLLFDLSLLQESASNAKDHKDEVEEMVVALESLEDELAVKSRDLDEAVAHGELLEAQLQEKKNMIFTLELDISEERESLKLLSQESHELRVHIEDILAAKSSIEEELMERRKVNEKLEEEILGMGNALCQMNYFIDSLKNDLNTVMNEKDNLESELLLLKENLEKMHALAEENEAIAIEARQIAESRKVYAEDKEEEVKLLERSVEELECTVNVLENKVEIVKGDAERQRLQREELEMELQAVRHQMLLMHTSGVVMDSEAQGVGRGDADFQWHLQEKETDLLEAQKQIEILEKDMAEKDAEISQCRAHISELNLHAEAQAREYKQKFKALEAMAEQVRSENTSSYVTNSTSNKPEKPAAKSRGSASPFKSRGSGSPFKCIGLGLAQQINSEKDEELTAGRHRIEELEALAASRQKEVFMLNARLAAAESMTHDVIRDLLGVKLDMTNYASLMDHQQVQKITGKVQLPGEESQVKEQEVFNLKQQINEFIEEKKRWLEEINQKHAEMVAARIALEKLRQRDQFLTTENEMLKVENANHKKNVMELEEEMKKLSGQQNLQQRIHHHAKIKEENNLLKIQNDDLSAKLRRTETILSRVREELARYRASNGRSPFTGFDEEQRLNDKPKENDEERLQLAEKLVGLCTSILKASGITRPVSDVTLPAAEEALCQMKDRITTLETELEDLKFKNRISSEKIRLSELKPQSSPNSRRGSQTSFVSALSR
ncbi:kinesin-like protein KIN-12D isoform X2 [Macadamia integrifolia]|uniref:kinesin-like protein KIN-12D isoform X2 n=1 Tax=Macadamia integrifolia TaxID=60698 RepID=UPI001C4F352C|nr:kinesin-like protein KIN-12D isoform X2 [Macadamia integrifolia]